MKNLAVKLLLSLAFWLLLTVTAFSAPSALHPVSFTAHITPADPHPGEYVSVAIDATIAPGWHLYSLTPTPPPGPTPTSVTVADTARDFTQVGPVSEDAPIKEIDPNFAKAVEFHQDHAQYLVPLRNAAHMAGGGDAVQATVHFQTCNNTVCLPPTSETLSLRIKLTAGAVRPKFAQVPQQLANDAPLPVEPVENMEGSVLPASIHQSSLWRFALAAFGGGLLALLTPCVFPLIPVTFGFFTKQAADNRRRLITLAGVYAIGIIVTFVALGLVAALLFGAAGANRVAANPWFNLFFGLLFVAFAFSFFESFIVTLPQGLNRFARPSSESSGIGGVLLMGLAFVFAAFTCTAPFIGTVLVAAASATGAREWLRPLLGMGCFALALALPFFLLALFPSLLSRLPRSGGWMTRFKAALGFVELAYALTYFSKADLIWQAHILTQPLIYALWAAIAFAGMLYLLGILRVSAYPDEPTRLSAGRMVGAGIFCFAGLYCLYALTGRQVNVLVTAYLPPNGYGPSLNAAVSLGSNQPVNLASDTDWLSSYPDALAQSKTSGKPVFVDFTGYTCTNCRYVENTIFPNQPVNTLLTSQVTRLRLYTDGGANGPANQALQQKLFGTVALPLYAMVSPDGKVLSQLTGSNSSPEQFGKFIQTGLQLAHSQPANPSIAAATSPPASNHSQPATPPAAIGAAASWTAYTPAALAEAGSAGKPAVVDFTASWCTNCHALERTVFTAPPVSSRLPQFATFSANFDLPANAPSEQKYNIVALPAVLFFDKHGHEVPGTRVTGLITAADFAARLKKAEAA